MLSVNEIDTKVKKLIQSATDMINSDVSVYEGHLHLLESLRAMREEFDKEYHNENVLKWLKMDVLRRVRIFESSLSLAGINKEQLFTLGDKIRTKMVSIKDKRELFDTAQDLNYILELQKLSDNFKLSDVNNDQLRKYVNIKERYL